MLANKRLYFHVYDKTSTVAKSSIVIRACDLFSNNHYGHVYSQVSIALSRAATLMRHVQRSTRKLSTFNNVSSDYITCVAFDPSIRH